jgi:hypothetical protein
VSNDEQLEHTADDDGSNKEGEGGKANGDGNEGGGRQKGQGQQRGQWRRRQGWRATKRAMVIAAREMEMATRVMGEQQQQGQW